MEPVVQDSDCKEKILEQPGSDPASEHLKVQHTTSRLLVLGFGLMVLYAGGVRRHAKEELTSQAAGIVETAFVLPVISDELGISSSNAQWVAASLMLTWVRRFAGQSSSETMS
jgi:hypothetical protein